MDEVDEKEMWEQYTYCKPSLIQYLINRSSHPSLSIIVFFSGIIRTLSCGGWVYITSEDDHDAHDILMITYIVCNIPWMLGGIICTPKGERWAVQRKRR